METKILVTAHIYTADRTSIIHSLCLGEWKSLSAVKNLVANIKTNNPNNLIIISYEETAEPLPLFSETYAEPFPNGNEPETAF